jgi:hypothetical protein
MGPPYKVGYGPGVMLEGRVNRVTSALRGGIPDRLVWYENTIQEVSHISSRGLTL